jgi:hypothetical protein
MIKTIKQAKCVSCYHFDKECPPVEEIGMNGCACYLLKCKRCWRYDDGYCKYYWSECMGTHFREAQDGK